MFLKYATFKKGRIIKGDGILSILRRSLAVEGGGGGGKKWGV
jgi:hypothetical protein